MKKITAKETQNNALRSVEKLIKRKKNNVKSLQHRLAEIDKQREQVLMKLREEQKMLRLFQGAARMEYQERTVNQQ